MKIQGYSLKKGFSLIEVMVAMVIGIILLAGLITVFETTLLLNKTQNGLARIQENGRFAMVHIKQNAEQAGYQYCLASTLGAVGTNEAVTVKPWIVYPASVSPGLPTRSDVISNNSQIPPPAGAGPYLLDSAYFIHGHECGASSCAPTLTSFGSATRFTIPTIGTGNGDRLAGTDVLTFRYVSGAGISVNDITTSAGGIAAINYTFPQTSFPAPGDRVVISSCDGQPSRVVDLIASTGLGSTVNVNGNISGTSAGFTRLFDLANDTSTITYYVANNQIADGAGVRDVPTLYSVVNGVSNALIEGVDRFDVLYGVQTKTGVVMILNAQGVDNLPIADCVSQSVSSIGRIVNIAGCGWRSVVSMEVHLLLNTTYDSSTNDNEPYQYSLDGQALQHPSDLSAITGINTYRMHRKEFTANITMKNY